MASRSSSPSRSSESWEVRGLGSLGSVVGTAGVGDAGAGAAGAGSLVFRNREKEGRCTGGRSSGPEIPPSPMRNGKRLWSRLALRIL